MKVDLLVLSPHPDDAELFCGGTLAAAAVAGLRVAIADLTRGEMASNGTVEGRRAASLAACEALGILDERPQLGLPDAGLSASDEQQALAIASLLRAHRPRVLLVPWREDRHPDHVAASSLGERASFLCGLRNARLQGEAHQVEQLYYYPCHRDVGEPTEFVDVSAVIDRWREALRCYRDQFERASESIATPINEPDFLARQEARRVEWGRQSGVAHAETLRGARPRAVRAQQLFGSEST